MIPFEIRQTLKATVGTFVLAAVNAPDAGFSQVVSGSAAEGEVQGVEGVDQERSRNGPDAVSQDSNVLEEVTVYGHLPLTTLRFEVYRAEDNYFASFNELNSKDEFDIYCRWEAPTGTRIKQRQCRARFYAELEYQAARQWRQGSGIPPQQWLASQQALIEDKARRLNEEMRRLVIEHPQLFDALNEFDAAKERFESEHERRCAGRILFCRR